MSKPYMISADGYLDLDGEHDVLAYIMDKFGAGAFPLLTDRYGEYILTDEINVDFEYKTEYEYEDGKVLKTYISILGYTLNIPIDVETASKVNYLIHKKNEWVVVKDSYFDFVYYSDDAKKRCEMNIEFDLRDIKGVESNKGIEDIVLKDNSNLLMILYEAGKDGHKDEQSKV